jgi:hypothetical protein
MDGEEGESAIDPLPEGGSTRGGEEEEEEAAVDSGVSDETLHTSVELSSLLHI